LKRDVLHQLVAKKDHVVKIQMTDSQRQLYGDIIQRHILRKNQSQVNSKPSSEVADLTGPSLSFIDLASLPTLICLLSLSL
jgi:hypothetical protein